MPGYTLSEGDDDEKWDAYLVESILHPEAKIVKDFANNMPSQEGAFSDTPGGPPPKLSDIVARIGANKPTTNKEKKLAAIVEYIKFVGNPKYYKAMKTPEAAPEASPAPAEPANPQATPSKPEAKASGRADKSKTPSPAPRKE